MNAISRAAPIAPSERILALDVTRGLALCGILLMNIVGMGLPFAAYFNPAWNGPPSQADYTTWFITNTFFEGTMRTLFSMLFGAGFLVILQRLEAKGYGLDGAKIYLRRACILIGLGLINACLLVWGGDILFTYGICGAFLLVFYKSKIRGLVVWAAILFAAMTLFNFQGLQEFSEKHHKYELALVEQKAGKKLTEEQSAIIESYPKQTSFWSPSKDDVADQVDAHKTWAALSAQNYKENYSTPLNIFAELFLFDALFAMILGMIAFRIGLLQGTWSTSSVIGFTLISLAVALPIRLWQTFAVVNSHYSIEGFFLSQMTYHLGRVPLACFWLGVALLIARLPWVAWIRIAFAAIGRMALTNYLAHSAITSFVFVGLHYYNKLGRSELYLVVAGCWAFSVVFSLLWLALFRMGPVEWLWRAGTYGYFSPLLKAAPKGDADA